MCYINIHPQNCCLHQAVNMFSSAVMLTWCFAVTDSSGRPRKLSFLVPSLIFYHLGGTLRCSTELRVMIDWLLRLKMYSVSLLCINLERRWEKQATRHHLLTRRSRLLGCMRLKTNFYSIQHTWNWCYLFLYWSIVAVWRLLLRNTSSPISLTSSSSSSGRKEAAGVKHLPQRTPSVRALQRVTLTISCADSCAGGGGGGGSAHSLPLLCNAREHLCPVERSSGMRRECEIIFWPSPWGYRPEGSLWKTWVRPGKSFLVHPCPRVHFSALQNIKILTLAVTNMSSLRQHSGEF